jgi:hypothetical protein
MRRRSYQGKPFAVSPSANIPLRASSAPMELLVRLERLKRLQCHSGQGCG